MTRSISHSEAQTLLDCPARWDFSYGGHLAGTALAPRVTAPRLREGRAWGRAAAVLQANSTGIMRHSLADQELRDALAEDAADQEAAGVYDEDAHGVMATHLAAVLTHYNQSWEPLQVDRVEHELDVPVPSRGGRRRSNRYRFVGYVDAIHTDEHGDWIVENKLRTALSSFEQVALARQTRWYAWAWREATGHAPVGVIVEERLNEAPKPPKVLKDGRPSSDKRQLTTPRLYRDACITAGVAPDEETIDAFRARRWQHRHRVFLTPTELDEAGRQLVSVARLVHLMDAGDLYPVRNPAGYRCPGCQFRDICTNHADAELVDALFDRVPAKRNRDLEMTPA